MKNNKNLSFKKIKKIYHEEIKQEQPVVEVKIEQLEVLPELAPIVEHKPEPEPVKVVEGNEALVDEFLAALGATNLVEVVTTAPIPKVNIPASSFVDMARLDDFLKSIEEEVPAPAPIVEQTPTLVTPVTKEVVDLTKPTVSSKKPKLDPNIKAINDRLGLFEKRLGDLAMRPIGQDPGGGETKLRFLDDIDRSTIGDGKYLNYNDTTKKFQFSTLSGGGAPQVQSDWTQSDNTEPSFIKNKPSLFSGSYNDLTDVPITSQIYTLNPSPSPSTPFRAGVSTTITNGTYAVNISAITGISGFAVSKDWYFTYDGEIIFPDDSIQTTAWTGTYSYDDLTDKPTIPDAQIQSDWNQTNNTALDYIKNKPAFVTDITSVDNTVQISANEDGTHDLSVAASLSTSVDKVFAYVTNDDSVTIHKGQPVYLYRATGNRPSVILARNTSDQYSAKTLGLASQDIAAGNPGWVQTQGVLTGIDTHTYSEGDTLYLGATAGTLTNVKPHSPNHLVYIGVVVRANKGQGQIYIKPQNGYELEELHNVNIDDINALEDGHYLKWSEADSQWVNDSFPSISWSEVTDKPQNIVTLNDTDVITNDMLVNSSITIGSTAVELGSSITTLTGLTGVTSNHTTAFIAGDNAISGVALQIPREGALRNLHNGANNNMYFDVSVGGTAHGQFQFRSSNAFTNVLTMSPTAFNVNPNAVVTARTPSFGRTAWNSAIDTELTIDDMRFRISNQGGIYPQVIGNGSSRNLGWTGVGAISGSAVTQVGSTGTIVASNSWTTLYNAQSMNSAGDTVTVTLQDKGVGRIYRITFIRSDNGSTTGYNIIAERLL